MNFDERAKHTYVCWERTAQAAQRNSSGRRPRSPHMQHTAAVAAATGRGGDDDDPAADLSIPIYISADRSMNRAAISSASIGKAAAWDRSIDGMGWDWEWIGSKLQKGADWLLMAKSKSNVVWEEEELEVVMRRLPTSRISRSCRRNEGSCPPLILSSSSCCCCCHGCKDLLQFFFYIFSFWDGFCVLDPEVCGFMLQVLLLASQEKDLLLYYEAIEACSLFVRWISNG